MKIADYFDRIYIINLPERVDRRRHMEKEIGKLSLTPNSDKVHFFKAIKPEQADPFESRGARGVSLSHFTILQEAQTQGLERVLILEDDADFGPQFLAAETFLVEQLSSQPWDMVQFGYHFDHSIPSEDRVIGPADSPAAQLFPFAKEVIGAHCCGFSAMGISKMVPFLNELFNTPPTPERPYVPIIDGAYNIFSWREDTTRLLPRSSLVSQVSSRSDITPRVYDKIPIVRSLLTFLRTLKYRF